MTEDKFGFTKNKDPACILDISEKHTVWSLPEEPDLFWMKGRVSAAAAVMNGSAKHIRLPCRDRNDSEGKDCLP